MVELPREISIVLIQILQAGIGFAEVQDVNLTPGRPVQIFFEIAAEVMPGENGVSQNVTVAEEQDPSFPSRYAGGARPVPCTRTR